MRRLILAAIALLLAGLAAWAFWPRPVPVELAEIAPRDLTVVVEEDGEARIREVFTVSATLSGNLQRIGLHAGDRVIRNATVVAEIGPAAPALLDARARSVAEATAAAARAAMELAQAQLDQAAATLDFATAERDRAAKLVDRATISSRAYDNAVRDQRTAQAAVASARANLAMRERELDSANAVLMADDSGAVASCCVRIAAPVTGTVLRVLTESEQVVQPGMPIMEIGDPTNLEIVADFLSRDAVRIREGAEAWVTGWGGPPLPARVERVEPMATTEVSALGISEQRVQTILRLDGPPEAHRALGHGFRVVVRVTVWQGRDVLSVPLGALLRDGPDWAVFVVEGGRARLRRIAIGEQAEDHAQVIDGLAAGDRVILHASDRVAEGVAVTDTAR